MVPPGDAMDGDLQGAAIGGKNGIYYINFQERYSLTKIVFTNT